MFVTPMNMACSKFLQKLIQNETPNNTHNKNLTDVQCRSKIYHLLVFQDFFLYHGNILQQFIIKYIFSLLRQSYANFQLQRPSKIMIMLIFVVMALAENTYTSFLVCLIQFYHFLVPNMLGTCCLDFID